MARHSPFFMREVTKTMDTLETSRLAIELKTERLTLRVPGEADAASIERLIGDWDVAQMLGRVPHPYPEGGALEWMAELRPKVAEGKALILGLVEKDRPEAGAIGCVGLEPREGWDQLELGYWLGKPYWGRGYMTEAAKALVDHGFGAMALDRIGSGHLPENLASRSVLTKLGFRDVGEEQRWSRPRNCETTVTLMMLERRDYLAAQDGSE